MFVLSTSLASFLVLCTTASLSPPKNGVQLHTGSVAFANATYSVEWALNDTAITFTINSSIHKGWFLLGWMQMGDAGVIPKKLNHTRGDVLVFLQKKVLDCNTISKKGRLQKDKDVNILSFNKQENGKSGTVWRVTRKLGIANKDEDVAIKPGPMLLFGAYGDTVNSSQHLKDITVKDIDDSIEFVPVHFVQGPPTITPSKNISEENNGHFREFVEHVVRVHWIAVLVVCASVVTVFITVVVYCCCKKKTAKNKKVKVSFFKEEEDFDQEARVALISATT